MGKKKLIENYELLEVVDKIEDMYDIYKARHLQQNKLYTIKKVKIKNDKNNRLYEGFLNQASLLKSIQHPNITKSIKMMKTPTSIYVVYDHCDGLNLNDWMQKGSKRTIVQKQAIIKQLFIVCNELKMTGIAHLYINPESIYVSEQGDVKVTNFMYGINMPEIQQQVQLHEKIPKTDFTAPQVKKGKASYQSDIYSFGKIIEFMEVQNSKRGNLSEKQFDQKVEQYDQIIKRTTKRKVYERESIDDVYKLIFKGKGKLRKMKSMSMSLSKIGGKESMLSKASLISTATGRQKSSHNQQIILKILKRRNISRLIVQIFKNIVDSNYPNSTELLILVTLLLKKSTIILNSIGKFMKYGKGIPTFELNQKQRNRFIKCSDYFKLQPLIDFEVKTQKKLFEQALQSIYLDNIKILQDKRFNLQLKKQQLDESYLRELMKSFIRTSVDQLYLEAEHTSFLKTIYLMSLVLDQGSFEIFFEKKVALVPVDLNQQQIFQKIHKNMTIPQLIEELEKYRTVQNLT